MKCSKFHGTSRPVRVEETPRSKVRMLDYPRKSVGIEWFVEWIYISCVCVSWLRRVFQDSCHESTNFQWNWPRNGRHCFTSHQPRCASKNFANFRTNCTRQWTPLTFSLSVSFGQQSLWRTREIQCENGVVVLNLLQRVNTDRLITQFAFQR
jgi:hypothetical protein